MKIIQESKRVLINLYAEFLKDESAYAPCIKINMKELADSLNVSNENLNLYLWFLSDAEYIKCDVVYNSDENAKKTIFFLPKAIRLLEDDNSI